MQDPIHLWHQIRHYWQEKLPPKIVYRIPYEMKISFCKKCKNFIAPGINSRIRIGRTSLKSIRITCLLCGHTYRKVIE